MIRKIKINKMNKKGSITGIITMIGIILGLAIAVIIFSRVFLAITEELKDSGKFSDRAVEKIEIAEDNTIPLLDFFIFFVLISLMIGLIISAIFMDTHPVITVAFLIVLVIAVFLSGIIANAYAEVAEESALASTADQFTYTNLVLGSHFPIIILVLVIIIVIILFSKSRRTEV